MNQATRIDLIVSFNVSSYVEAPQYFCQYKEIDLWLEKLGLCCEKHSLAIKTLYQHISIPPIKFFSKSCCSIICMYVFEWSSSTILSFHHLAIFNFRKAENYYSKHKLQNTKLRNRFSMTYVRWFSHYSLPWFALCNGLKISFLET